MTYLQMYLIDFTEWQYSTLQWALNVLDRSGEYGTTQELSTVTSMPLTLTVIVLPPSFGDRR